MVESTKTKRKYLIKLGLKELNDQEYEAFKLLLNDESLHKYIYDFRRNAILLDVELFDFIIYHLIYDKRYAENLDVTLLEVDDQTFNNVQIIIDSVGIGSEMFDELIRVLRFGSYR